MFFDPRMIGRVCLSLREVITPVVNGLKPTYSQEYIYIHVLAVSYPNIITSIGTRIWEYFMIFYRGYNGHTLVKFN